MAVDLPALAAGRPVVAVVRDAHRHPWILERLAGLAAVRPDLVTVEMGWPAPVRLPGGTVVRTLGASAVSAEVAAEVLAGGVAAHTPSAGVAVHGGPAGLAVQGLGAGNGTAAVVRPRHLHAGLDIGGSKVLAVAVDAAGHVLGEVRVGTTLGHDGVVESASTAVTTLAGRLGVAVGGFASVGIGVPGLVDARTGAVRHAVNLGIGADALALAERLEHRFGVPVAVENDVNAAAVGAAACLDLRGVDLAYLSIGTGLASGLVLGGHLRRGARSAAGEIGHVPVDPSGPPCACGQRGCLELLASGSAITAAWPDRSPAGSEGAGAPRARDLFAAAAEGDPRAVAVRADAARHLASAVRLLILTVDVDVVVLGGGVAEVGEPLRAAVVAALADQAERSPFLHALDLPSRVRIVPAGLPVAAVGAALLGREALGPQAEGQGEAQVEVRG
jgi:predicted NBD/HSP70 family sugar kinase